MTGSQQSIWTVPELFIKGYFAYHRAKCTLCIHWCTYFGQINFFLLMRILASYSYTYLIHRNMCKHTCTRALLQTCAHTDPETFPTCCISQRELQPPHQIVFPYIKVSRTWRLGLVVTEKEKYKALWKIGFWEVELRPTQNCSQTPRCVFRGAGEHWIKNRGFRPICNRAFSTQAFPGLDDTLAPRRGSCDSISTKEKQLTEISNQLLGPGWV